MRITPWLRAWRKRELRRRLPDGMVSPHFRHMEFWTKDGTPIPTKAIPGLEKHCRRFLEPLRSQFGPCTVMSGYRHEAYNRAIGGATDSQHDWDEHPTGVATDLIFARGTPDQWGKAAAVIRAKTRSPGAASNGGGGIGVYMHQGFVHLDSRAQRADWRG